MAFAISLVKNGVIRRSALPRAHLFFCTMHVSFQRGTGALLIGAGIQVRPSSLGENSGMGAYVTESVSEGSIVTVYDGWLVLRALIPRVGEARDLSQWSHCMTIKSTDFAVLGLRDAIVGRGAGSFINHSKHLQNVIAVNVTGKLRWDYFGDAAVTASSGTQLPVLAMVASRDIKAGDELFTCYPSGVCTWMGVEYDSGHPDTILGSPSTIHNESEGVDPHGSHQPHHNTPKGSGVSQLETFPVHSNTGVQIPRQIGINSTNEVKDQGIPSISPSGDDNSPSLDAISPEIASNMTAEKSRLLGSTPRPEVFQLASGLLTY